MRAGEKVFDVLDDIEIASLPDYSGSGYEDLNRNLVAAAKGQQVGNPDVWNAYRDIVNSAISKLPSHVGIVNRGITATTEGIKRYQVGSVNQEYVPTSTSFGLGFGGNVKFKIHQKHGANINIISANYGENEILLKAGKNYRVLKRTESERTTFITLEEVED